MHVGKNLVQGWDLKIENPVKTGYKLEGDSKRTDIQFRFI